MNRPPIISPEPVFFDNRRQSRRPLAGRMAFNNMESDAATGPGGQPPEISIITPCYNAVHHLRDAIESVRRQAGVRIEHIVVDAASKDGTVDVLREFPDVRWISEPDQGQADAFNKGLALARAPLIGWLNADDMYEPGALAAVVRFFREHPDAFLVNGHLIRVDPAGKQLEYLPAKSSRFWLRHFWFRWYWLNHPSTFYRKVIFDAIGPIDTRLHYAMDYDFYLRASQRFEFYDIDFLTTRMRVHPDAKTSHGWDNLATQSASSNERPPGGLRCPCYRRFIRSAAASACVCCLANPVIADWGERQENNEPRLASLYLPSPLRRSLISQILAVFIHAAIGREPDVGVFLDLAQIVGARRLVRAEFSLASPSPASRSKRLDVFVCLFFPHAVEIRVLGSALRRIVQEPKHQAQEDDAAADCQPGHPGTGSEQKGDHQADAKSARHHHRGGKEPGCQPAMVAIVDRCRF
jgi:hypothetical protein